MVEVKSEGDIPFSPDGVYVCHRIYASGDVKYTIRDRTGLRSWFNYNTDFRPGCSLYVEGLYVGNMQHMHLPHHGDIGVLLLNHMATLSRHPEQPRMHHKTGNPFNDCDAGIRYPDEQECGNIERWRYV